jgi:AbrB family looped-hinge helix DNA binding protein
MEAVVSKELTVDAQFRVTISSDGQITIPPDVREFWNLGPGDQLSLERLEEGGGRIRPVRRRSIFESRDTLPKLSIGRPVTQQDIEDAITEAVTDKEKRSRGT